ncbi:MAG: hypothetical protein JWN71_3725 [Xanthobacteraceae bacterium]|jgi:hypothetical protein|nr:hypothetical protein [Xanthobacteraceae bacterium]
MRKSALLIAAATLAVCLPGLASAAPAAPADPNANSKKFMGAWISQILVPGQSLTKPAAAEPAKKVGKKSGKKKMAKAKGGKKKS